MSTSTATDATGTYTIDPVHSRIGFVARHAMVTKVRGHVHQVRGLRLLRRRQPGRLAPRADDRCHEHRHRQRRPRRPPAQQRLLRHGEVPADHVQEHRRRSRWRRHLSRDRRSHDQGRHQAGHRRLRGHRHRRRPMGQHSPRPRGLGADQPQGLGRQLERRPGSRRRAGEREGHPRVRRLRHQAPKQVDPRRSARFSPNARALRRLRHLRAPTAPSPWATWPSCSACTT